MGFDISKKQAVDAIRRKYHDERSSHTFNNLYVWKNAWKIDLYLEEDMYATTIGEIKDNNWYFPVGNEERKKIFIANQITKGKLSFYYMSDNDMNFLEVNFPGVFKIERDMGHDEYLTKISDHMAKSGKKNRNLRWAYRRFQDNAPYDVRRFEDGLENDVMSVLQKWYESKGYTEEEGREMMRFEHDAFFEIQPDDFDKFIVYSNAGPFAVVTGYPIANDVYDICILKQNGEIKHATYGVLYLMMEMLGNKYTFINKEDDLGIQGLRSMKKQELTCKMNEMWKAKLL